MASVKEAAQGGRRRSTAALVARNEWLTSRLEKEAEAIVEHGLPQEPIEDMLPELDVEELGALKGSHGLGRNVLAENPKLREWVLQCVAVMASTAQIQHVMQEKLGFQVGANAISYYRTSPKWRDIINKRRKVLLRNVDDIPLAHPRKRMLALQQLYEEVPGIFSDRKAAFIRKQKLLADAKAETKQDVALIGGNINVQNNVMTLISEMNTPIRQAIMEAHNQVVGQEERREDTQAAKPEEPKSPVPTLPADGGDGEKGEDTKGPVGESK